jgi:colanic acid biosynthesis glycosyl transferase WcaI
MKHSQLRVAFVCPVFPPEPEPSGVMAHELAGALQSRGYGVTVFTSFPNRPAGRGYPGYRRSLRFADAGFSCRVIRSGNCFIGPRRRTVNRLLENLTFGLSSAINLCRDGDYDVILGESWPLAAMQILAWVSRTKKVPLIYYVKDIYPEVLESSNLIAADGFAAQRLRRWDARICRDSRALVVISQGMKEIFTQTRHVAPDKIFVIKDWLDESVWPRTMHERLWRRELNIPDEATVALYAGNMGTVSNAGILVDVAKLLRSNKDIVILCVGEGVLKLDMVARARAESLTNILFMPFQPREQLSRVFGAADVALLTTRSDYGDASVPSKLISYMAASRPVICAAAEQSTVARTVVDSGSGIVVQPGDTGEIASAICYCAENPGRSAEMGKKGREWFESHHTLSGAAERFCQILDHVTMPGQIGES